MADVDVRMRVVADTAEASKGLAKVGDGLDEVEKAAKRAQRASEEAVASADAGAGKMRTAAANPAQTVAQTVKTPSPLPTAEQPPPVDIEVNKPPPVDVPVVPPDPVKVKVDVGGAEREKDNAAADKATGGGGAAERDWYSTRWIRNIGFRDASEAQKASSDVASERDKARILADEFAKRAGTALAKVVVGYMAHQGVDTAFALMRRPGRDNRRIEQAEATVKGAIDWGAAGNAVAGPLGAVVGGLIGGLNSFVLKEKEIRDAAREANIKYRDARKSQGWATGRRQEDMIFGNLLERATPDKKAEMIAGRISDLTGGGENERHFFRRYRNAEKTDADKFAEMRSNMDWAVWAELHNGGRGTDGKLVSVGGNMAGTRNYYEILARYLTETRGEKDRETQQILDRRDALNNRIDPMREQQLGVYLGDLERLRGFARTAAITDSASSKGLGVGAQIGAMQNERLLRGIDRVVNMIQKMGDKAVDALREQGGAYEAVARAM